MRPINPDLPHADPHAHPRPSPMLIVFVALAAVTLLALALITPVQAADDFGPAPADAAFVRVFNASPQALPDVKIGDRLFAAVPAYAMSESAWLAAGTYPVDIAGAAQSLTLAGSRLYTAVVSATGVKLIEGERFVSRLKAQVVLVNLTDAPALSLRLADGTTAVVDAVAPGAAGARAVNAVRATLAVFDGERKIADTRPVTLQRGRTFGLFVAGTREQPVSVWVIDPAGGR